jgi:hypothetical protein
VSETLVGHTPDGEQVAVIERNHPLSGNETWIEHGHSLLLLRRLHPGLIPALQLSLAASVPTGRDGPSVAQLAAADQLVPEYDQVIDKFLRECASWSLTDRGSTWNDIAEEVHDLFLRDPGRVVFLAASALFRLLEAGAPPRAA